MMGSGVKRGAFIVIEGLDRSGKSTQSKLLYEALIGKQQACKLIRFPDRTSTIGKLINDYLTSNTELDDHAIHLLFSADRWQHKKEITNMLDSGINWIILFEISGITVISDRYIYSGIAFSSAKGLDLEWCKASDSGLPIPDLVFFFDLPIEEMKRRAGFGDEKYEKTEFQMKVATQYSLIKENSWHIIDATLSIEKIKNILLEQSLQKIDELNPGSC